MAAPQLLHEVTRCADGTIHVQDVHRFALGVHRVHSAAAFERWQKQADAEIETSSEATCDCGLAPGQVREINDRVWFDPQYGDTQQTKKQSKAASTNGAVKSGTPAPTQPARGVPAAQPEEVNPMAKAKKKQGKADRSDAAKRAWAERRKRHGKTGISKEKRAARKRPAAKRK